MNIIRIFCDGGTRNNGKENAVGGWGSFFTFNEHKKELFGGERGTTNNRMELTAVIEGLKQLKTFDMTIEVVCDSAYVVNAFNQGWINNWVRNGWKTSKKEPVENQDLWKELVSLVNKCKDLKFMLIKGHVNLNKSTEVEKYYKRFVDQNKVFITKEDFAIYVNGNDTADLLANTGMDNLEV